MKNIVILYASVDGQTFKICNYIADRLKAKGNTVTMEKIELFNGTFENIDLLVIGASIRYGKHAAKVTNFIKKYRAQLSHTSTAFFSVNLVARKEGKNTGETNPYVQKFLSVINWTPNLLDAFAGCLDYDRYPFYDRIMIKMIMKMTGGPTHTDSPIEYTDWKRVDAFVERVEGV